MNKFILCQSPLNVLRNQSQKMTGLVPKWSLVKNRAYWLAVRWSVTFLPTSSLRVYRCLACCWQKWLLSASDFRCSFNIICSYFSSLLLEKLQTNVSIIRRGEGIRCQISDVRCPFSECLRPAVIDSCQLCKCMYYYTTAHTNMQAVF